MLLDARKGMILTQQDERKAFIVPQEHVVRRPETLDQLSFEQQRLGLGAGRHDRHRSRLGDHPLKPLRKLRDLRVVGDAVFQRPRLADIEYVAPRVLHAINARPGWQRLQDLADRSHAQFEVGLAIAANGVGRLLFIKALGGSRMLGTIGLTHPCQIGDSTLLREGYPGTWWRLDQIVTIPICTSRLPVLRKERRQSGFAKLGSALSCRLVDPDRSVGGLQEQSLDQRATIGFESWDRCFYSFFFHFCFGGCLGFKVTRNSMAISSMSQTH